MNKRLLKSYLDEGDNAGSMKILNNMALVLNGIGRLDEAFTLYHKVLKWSAINFGEFHQETLATRHNLAIILFDQDRFEKAKTEFEAVLNLLEKLFGKDHIETVITQHWLALEKLGRKVEALAVMKEVVLLREKVLGTNHPHTLLSKDKIVLWSD